MRRTVDRLNQRSADKHCVIRPSALKQVDPSGRPYHAVFIRAPLIEAVHGTAQALSSLPSGEIVVAQQGRLLATSFHPELTRDDRFHRYFLELAK